MAVQPAPPDSEGRPIPVRSGSPILLDDPESFWFVDSGSIDLYITSIRHGQPLGIRRHFITLASGRVFVGMRVDVVGEGVALVAVGDAGTKLVKFPITRLVHKTLQGNDSARVLLGGWFESVCARVIRPAPPRELPRLDPNAGQVALQADDVRSATRPCWIRGAGLRLFGHPQLTIADDTWVPLTPSTWFTTTTSTTVSMAELPDVLVSNPQLASFAEFHRLLLRLVAREVELDNDAEQARILRRQQSEAHSMDHSLSRLAALEEISPEFLVGTGAEQHPLHRAAARVGAALGVEMRPPVPGPQPLSRQEWVERTASASQVRIRRVALTEGWWEHDHGPLLGFHRDGPVALLQRSAERYDLWDPVSASRQPLTAELARTLDSHAFTFYRPLPSRELKSLDVARLVLSASKRDLGVAIVLGMVGGLTTLVIPMATAQIFDRVIPEADRSLLWQLIFAMGTIFLVGSLLTVTRSLAMLRAETRMSTSLQSAVWDRLLRLPAAFFRDYAAGDLADRANSIDAIRRTLSSTVLSSLMTSIFAFWNVILLFVYGGATLGWIALLLLLILGAVSLLSAIVQMHYQRRLIESQGVLAGVTLQLLTGMSKIRVAGAERRAFCEWAKPFALQRALEFSVGKARLHLELFSAALPVLATAVIFYVAASTAGQSFSTGIFLAFSSAFAVLQSAQLELLGSLRSALIAIAASVRVRCIFEAVPEANLQKEHPGQLRGDIEVNQVSFRYGPDHPTVLDGVSLRIDAGEFVAVVGASGSGKSTLLRLLLGFENPTSGAVFYSGRNLAGLEVQEVRRQLGVVLQNGRLLGGSIFENISGSRQMTPEQVWEAAEQAALADDIRAMPMGLQTLVSHGGTTLSGGQRQRLLIARALAAKPKLLLFDEATSALDNATQAMVSSSLDRLRVTRVVIAHRVSTIRNADRIIVLEGGRIVEEGGYDELMGRQSALYRLAQRQLV